jgi:hypothetical protein
MNKISTLMLMLLIVFSACKNDKTKTEESENEKVEVEAKAKETKITLSKLEGSTKYPEATISLEEPVMSDLDDETGKSKVDFSFGVENYELGAQTPEAGKNGLANSGKGQHIHFILDNDPYSAHYESNFSKEIGEGHHVLLAFLSRSYHESVKNAYLVQPITVGQPEGDAPDLSAPHMFYSRPKGTYSGKDTEKLLLDFFLVNTEISEKGNKVMATINGEEFTITEWAPYVIEGLDKGEVTVSLKLVDADGNFIPGPFNDVTRTVILE